MKKRIAEAWASYAKELIPATAPAIQVAETRKAFYAGAATVFTGLLHDVSAGDEITADDEALMADFQSEIDEFLAVEGRR